jgi:hypothetical protein
MGRVELFDPNPSTLTRIRVRAGLGLKPVINLLTLNRIVLRTMNFNGIFSSLATAQSCNVPLAAASRPFCLSNSFISLLLSFINFL